MRNHPRLARLKKLVTVEKKTSAGLRCSLWICTWKKTGQKVAIAFRRADHLHLGPFKTINEAKRADTLGWMLDSATISDLERRFEVRVILTVVRETGDIWIASIDEWLDPTRIYIPVPGQRVYGEDRMSLKMLPVSRMRESPGDRRIEIG